MPNLFIGRLFDLDKFRIPVHIATVVMAVSTILVAECKEYWQFVLCQGIVTGTACGIVFGPAVSAASQYFKRKRSTAIAIVACGSSVGGTIFPIAFNQLEKHVGFKWTMRILGLLQFAILILPNLVRGSEMVGRVAAHSSMFQFMKRRLPVSEVKGKLFALAAFRKLPLFLYTVSGFLCFLGLYTGEAHIQVYHCSAN
jgi:MCP family monocarboxylic acid transporter-like MFS transporter 10